MENRPGRSKNNLFVVLADDKDLYPAKYILKNKVMAKY